MRHLAAQLTLHRHIRSFTLAKNVPNASFSFYQTLRRFAQADGATPFYLTLKVGEKLEEDQCLGFSDGERHCAAWNWFVHRLPFPI
jgi:hypothetical protein